MYITGIRMVGGGGWDIVHIKKSGECVCVGGGGTQY